MSIRKTISVVIPTLNCEKNLSQALNSVKWADEKIVVDMGSIDGTVGVAKKFGAKVFFRKPENNNFDNNRLYGMKIAKGDWILKLDSDEILSDMLQKEIKNFLHSDNNNLNGINFLNHIFFFGKEIKHGPIKNNSHEMRMFRQGAWKYFPTKYHQQITINGKIGNFKNYYNHYNYSSISQFIEKTNRYTDFDSKVLSFNFKLSIILS
ncbi:glycosyltransferase family 2 protein, partial [Candidatus Gottesmanbacteria bacterium]|nr:glycosyltransferase family 2 protein [Candidatus Gottesmanbacteria bacterium]